MLGFPGFHLFCLRQFLQGGTAYIDPELNRGSFAVDLWHFLVLIDTKISAVSEYLFFCSLKQVRNRRCVVYIGCGRLNLVDQSSVPIYADMTLVPEVLLITLLHLMSIRIAFLLLVLCR